MDLYNITVKNTTGQEESLQAYKGKVVLIVNTASFCGYTKQLLGLERTYQKYKNQGFEILAFPSNQFLAQEPDDIATVVKRYHSEYGVTFPIFDKIDVNGENTSPLFQFLKEEKGFDPASETPEVMIPYYKDMDSNYENNANIKWNFTKFLVDKKGTVRHRFEPEVTPSHLEDAIEALLQEA